MREGVSSAIVLAAIFLSGAAFGSETITYSYDELGRLVASTNSGGPRSGKSTLTSYDPAGNRVTQAAGVPAPQPNSAGVFSVSGPATGVDEGASATFTISKTGPAYGNLSVNYATVNGSAAAPGDFAATSGTISFRSWETARTVSVPVLVDGAGEPAESFSLALSSPSAGASINVASASAMINANAGPNNPPVTQPNSVGVGVCRSTSVNVVANDSDPDGDPITLVSVGSSSVADLFVASSTTVSVTGYGSPGSQTVSYTVTDGRGGTATGSLTVVVFNGNGCM